MLGNSDRAASDSRWGARADRASGIKAAILAAGLGRRLEPLTAHHLPKPLFPLGGKVPISELWIRRLAEAGITDVSMNVCVQPEAIKRHFGDGHRFGLALDYVEERVPSGTLGGVCKLVLGRAARGAAGGVPGGEEALTAAPFAGATVIAPSGDIVSSFGADLLEEMYEIHRGAGAAFSMVVVPIPHDRRKDFGTVLIQSETRLAGPISRSGAVSGFVEKDPNSPSNLCNASIYMIETDLLKELDKQRTAATLDCADPFYDFGKHVFPAMLGKLPHVTLPKDYVTWAIEYDGGWFDVGTKRDYLRVNEYVLDGKLEIPLPYEPRPWGHLGTGVSIDFDRTRIRGPVVIGNDCVIEPGCVLGPYAVIGDGWTVGKGARIERSVLWERSSGGGEPVAAGHRIGPDVHIQESIVVGGIIEQDSVAQTVDPRPDGTLVALPIDFVPAGPRV